jgi:tetratricopeptide (TPR) repeat protein
MDQPEKALQDFEMAVQLSGDDIDYSWRAIAYAQLKVTGAAVRDIDKAIDRSPNNSFHHQYKGILNYGLGRDQQAVDAFTVAIQLLPTWAAHFIWRAAVYFDLCEFKKCLADLDKASTLDSGDGPLFWRGLLYLRLGQGKKGMYDLKAALAEAKKVTSADAQPPSRILFWLGVSYDLLGEADEAKLYLSRVHVIAPSESSKPSKFSEPARTYLLAGEFEKAKALYRLLFAGNYAVDVVKTEQSHLEMLCELYRMRNLEEVRDWFLAEKKMAYSTPLLSDGSQGEMSAVPRELGATIRVTSASISMMKRRSQDAHIRSSSF